MMNVSEALVRLGQGDRKGFTLIELLIVMVVLGILFTIGLFLFNDVRQSAQRTAAKAEVRAAYTQAKTHYVDSGGTYVDTASVVGAIAGDGLTGAAATIAGTSGTDVEDVCTLPDPADTHVAHATLPTGAGAVAVCTDGDNLFIGKATAGPTPHVLIEEDNVVDTSGL